MYDPGLGPVNQQLLQSFILKLQGQKAFSPIRIVAAKDLLAF